MMNSFSKTIQAAIWMTGTIVSFSAMAVSGREISFELDTFEIMMYRSIIGLIIVLLLAKLFKTHREITLKIYLSISIEIYRILRVKTYGFMLLL